MKKVILFLRGGGRFITCVEDENDVRNVGQRMVSGGFLRCKVRCGGAPASWWLTFLTYPLLSC